MVAHRSPKPPVRVRVLLPLPQKTRIFNSSFFTIYLKIIIKKEVIIINKFLNYFYTILIFLIIYISLFYFSKTYTLSTICSNTIPNFETEYYFSNYKFFWPVPGFHKITSPFGKRNSPTNGASINHSGIDIAATENSNIYSVASGKIIFVGFKGAGGCTIIIESNNFNISYCHVSPSFIVSIGQTVNFGDHIANVGPKNIYSIPNNPYKDSNGIPTNGATTGPHLHLTIKKDGIAVNPLDFF